MKTKKIQKGFSVAIALFAVAMIATPLQSAEAFSLDPIGSETIKMVEGFPKTIPSLTHFYYWFWFGYTSDPAEDSNGGGKGGGGCIPQMKC
jgi:hypothetical protein